MLELHLNVETLGDDASKYSYFAYCSMIQAIISIGVLVTPHQRDHPRVDIVGMLSS